MSGIEAISVASSKPFGKLGVIHHYKCYVVVYIDTAEKEAAFTMCMISNTPDRNTTPVTPSNYYTVNSFVNIIWCFQSFYMRLN